MFEPSEEPIEPDTNNIITLKGPQFPEEGIKLGTSISIRVDYKWIAAEILKRLKNPDLEDVIRILRELDEEQDKK